MCSNLDFMIEIKKLQYLETKYYKPFCINLQLCHLLEMCNFRQTSPIGDAFWIEWFKQDLCTLGLSEKC